ncbi:peroxiredoxin [Sphingobacteriales bacterium UPWRP_1]|nr:peroxiredoxin [Sphingobacteriales bacterium TSM_CSM]PSJ73906.1 peroxiredoxin [Sphingobacteriales bacterium UPWRP_1]
MTLQKGDKAPDFTLVSSDKKQVSLSDYKDGNLVILFFPMAFTSVCTKELCAMRDTLADYNRLNTSVVAISVDSPFTLDRFKTEQQLNFPLLSDFNKEASQAYGAFYPEFVFGMKGVSKRAAFVIDKSGTVQYAEVLDSAGDLPSFEKVRQTLAQLEG